jgi:hypothetical protein
VAPRASARAQRKTAVEICADNTAKLRPQAPAFAPRPCICNAQRAAPQSYGQRLGLVEGTSPRGLSYHCADEAGSIYSAPLHICQVVLLLLRQRRGAAGLGEL